MAVQADYVQPPLRRYLITEGGRLGRASRIARCRGARPPGRIDGTCHRPSRGRVEVRHHQQEGPFGRRGPDPRQRTACGGRDDSDVAQRSIRLHPRRRPSSTRGCCSAMGPEKLTAWEWFVGYLIPDALVANTDRHQENLAVIENGGRRLSPTFDHASSLAFQLDDGDRAARLSTLDFNRTSPGTPRGRDRSSRRRPTRVPLPSRRWERSGRTRATTGWSDATPWPRSSRSSIAFRRTGCRRWRRSSPQRCTTSIAPD